MRLFKRRRSIFLKLLIDQAERTMEGIQYLKDYMESEDISIAKDIDNKEKEGDEVRRILHIPGDVRVVIVTPLAYPPEDSYDEAAEERLGQRIRKDLKEVAYFGKWRS